MSDCNALATPPARSSSANDPEYPPSTSPVTRLAAYARRLATKLDSLLPFSLTLKIVAFVLALTWYGFLPVHLESVIDTDLGWHLRSGEWIVQHHQLPRTDLFSITGAGKAWVAYSWTFGVLIYEIAKNFDLLGVATFTLLAWMAMVIALFVLIRGRGAGFWSATGLTLAAGVVAARVVAPRPGSITVVLFILLLHILLREREKGYTRALWVIPPILWIWANVHVQFVYGLFLIGLFCIEPVLDWVILGRERAHKTSLQLWSVLGASTLATFLNPYGFGPYQVILDFVRQPLLAGYVGETIAMKFTGFPDYLVLVLSLAAAFALGRKKCVEPLWVMLLLWAVVFAFHMQRDIWMATTVALAIIATRPTKAEAPPENSRLWLYGCLGLILTVFVVLERAPANKDLVGLIATKSPVGAVAYIHDHHLQGPIFNNYNWGGFLIYALPELPVSIDGRTNVHGQDEVGQSIITWNLGPGWDRDPLLKAANLVIAPPEAPLTSLLKTDPSFKVVFFDRTCLLFQRVAPAQDTTSARIPSPQAIRK